MVWAPTKPSALATLRTKVLQIYGLTSDSDLQTVVDGFIDDTIKDMNSHLYEFNKIVESGLTLTGGTPTVGPTANAVYKESLAYLVSTANNIQQAPLIYLPYTKFMDIYGDQEIITTGHTINYTFRNVHGDGLITLGPTPSTGTANKFDLTIEYYRRIPLNSAEDPLNVVQELETALVFGAQKRLAIHIMGASHPDVVAFQLLEKDALLRLKGVDKRHPDQRLRFTIAGQQDRRGRNARSGTLFIRID